MYFESKLLHYELNCDYFVPGQDKSNHANILASKTINDFMIRYNPLFDKCTFILENNDDIFTLIHYVILCQIRSLTDFEFKIYHKPARLKHFFGKQEKYVSSKFFKKNDCILITSNNPIYKVEKRLERSKDIIDCRTIQLFPNEPTPEEIFILKMFYCLGLNDNIVKMNNENISNFNNWCLQPFNEDNYITDSLLEIVDSAVKPTISCIWLCGDNEQDSLCLQQVEKADTIAFYFYEGNVPPVLTDKTFAYLVKRKTNIPSQDYGNLNNKELVNEFAENGFNVYFYGNFPQGMEII